MSIMGMYVDICILTPLPPQKKNTSSQFIQMFPVFFSGPGGLVNVPLRYHPQK